ncbi:succinate dehydrogenase, cytochrome b556 subunit [Phytophthora cinnamomi]|uniref:succinate dehydrogenase, cytochrome b556 subunit n=1 Tax=Phytophthora cinnamomi TaxID=4785 RepID=UPI0035595FFE|nr:succinate dehydrogenase, cytochrome b556 subunit [Phytophthora cinnamomi]
MSLQVLSKKLASRAAAPTLARAVSTENYSATQAALGRPISPHVEIYKFPVTAISSIANRFAAMGMSCAFVGGAALGIVGADVPALIHAAQDSIPLFVPASKALVAFPVSYHLLCAARHSLWTYKPELINNADGPASCYAIFAAAGVITLGATAVTIKAPEATPAAGQ